jgi:hypothetical protein
VAASAADDQNDRTALRIALAEHRPEAAIGLRTEQDPRDFEVRG